MNQKINILTIRKSRYLFISVLIVTMLCACHEDVIDLDLSEFNSKIVIEGRLNNYPGPYTVQISKTTGLNESNSIHWISDATVRLYDNQGNFNILKENEQGRYTTNSFRGVPGRNYTLNVEIDRKQYTAKSKMPEPLQVQDINFDIVNPARQYYKLTISVINDENLPEYARIDIYRFGNINDSYLYSDKYADNKLVILDDFSSDFSADEYVQIVVSTLDENAYEFYQNLESLQEIADELDNPLSPGDLYNPASNFNNGALGYFSAYSLRVYTVQVGD